MKVESELQGKQRRIATLEHSLKIAMDKIEKQNSVIDALKLELYEKTDSLEAALMAYERKMYWIEKLESDLAFTAKD